MLSENFIFVVLQIWTFVNLLVNKQILMTENITFWCSFGEIKFDLSLKKKYPLCVRAYSVSSC